MNNPYRENNMANFKIELTHHEILMAIAEAINNNSNIDVNCLFSSIEIEEIPNRPSNPKVKQFKAIFQWEKDLY